MGPPSPSRLPLKPAAQRRPSPEILEKQDHEKADSKKSAPTKRSRSYPRSLHPHNGDVTGHGYSEACHPRIPERAWHSAPYGWPRPVRRGTVATLTLMSSTKGYQYGPWAVGPFRQRDTRRRPGLPSRPETGPAPRSRLTSPLEEDAPLRRQDAVRLR